MTKILLIMTGGTICTTLDGSVLSADTQSAVPKLVDHLKGLGGYDDLAFEVIPALNILSENMTFARLNSLLDTLRGLDYSSCDGVIIAHGTDTLAYTSSLLALVMAGIPKPVMLVSSDRPLHDPEANGHANFRAAADLIRSGFGPGVYVPYRNADGIVWLHRGAHLRQCANFTADFFSSDMTPADRAEPYPVQAQHPMLYALRHLFDCVLKIEPYVGIDYSLYRLPEHLKAVLHGTYHSSTACVQRSGRDKPYTRHSALYLLGECRDRGIDFWLTPFPDREELCDGAYSSTADLLTSGAHPVRGLTNETAYMKLALAYSLGYEKEEVEAFLAREAASEKL